MLVMKFGGTSLGDLKRIGNVADLIERMLDRKPLVTVSAHSKVTDMLLTAATEAKKGNVEGPMEAIRTRHRDILKGLNLDIAMHDAMFDDLELILKGISLIRELTPRTLDMVQSFGERASSRTLAGFMRSRGHENCRQYDAWDLGMYTDSNFMKARPLESTYETIAVEVSRHSDELIVTTGFIAKDSDGNITTLGRGGSDYTAAIFGAAVDSEEIQIWTDVDGVMTADPRIIPEAQSIKQLSFDEASELAYFGGKVLHPSTMKPAMEKDIPIRVLNTFRPDHPGTVITKTPIQMKQTIKSIVAKREVTMINIVSTRMLGAPGFMSELFNVFSRYEIVIDLISTSEVSVSLTVEKSQKMDDAIAELKKTEFRPRVNIQPDKAIVSVVGHGMRHTIGLAGKVFTTLGKANVNIQMISQGSSEINISILVDNSDVTNAVTALHEEFFGGV